MPQSPVSLWTISLVSDMAPEKMDGNSVKWAPTPAKTKMTWLMTKTINIGSKTLIDSLIPRILSQISKVQRTMATDSLAAAQEGGRFEKIASAAAAMEIEIVRI